jgi:hypothetical protein
MTSFGAWRSIGGSQKIFVILSGAQRQSKDAGTSTANES